jgi:anti-sigma regulatory factor (Ser/Thr protein kinase)
MDFELQVALPLNARLLPKTRQAVAGYLEETAASPEELHDVILALDEACANVIRHAFPGDEEGKYHVRAEVRGNEVRVAVEDHGVGFDPERLEQDWVEPQATSGRGLAIIRTVMSSVDVEPAAPEGGTRLVMRKTLD